jgi:hypothetical protein
MQSNLTYFIRDKHGKKTDTTAPITIEVIRSKVRYDEVVRVRYALCWIMRRNGLKRAEIAECLNIHQNNVIPYAVKADMRVVKEIRL